MKMVIKKLIMEGFKNHVTKVEHDLGDFTKIRGDNGKGKTTIGEGICWALFGANLWANERADSVLVNPESKVTNVEVVFDIDGVEYTAWRRRKGSKTDIFLGDKKVNNNDIVDLLKDKKVFFSIFNPAYFPTLAPKDAKELLMDIIPDVNMKEVMEQLDNNSRSILEKAGFRNADVFIQDKREELREVEEELLKKQGLLEGLNGDNDIPEEVIFDDTELIKLKQQLEELENIKPPHDITALKEQKLQLAQQILDIKSKNKPELKDVTQLQEQITELMMKAKMTPCEPPRYLDIMSMQEKLSSLGPEYNRCKAKLDKLNENNGIDCPKCGTIIDLNGDEKQRLQKEIDRLIAEGNDLNVKIQQAVEKNEAMKAEYARKLEKHTVECKTIIKQLQNEISAIEFDNEKLIQQHEQSIMRDIASIEQKIENLMIEEKEIENQNYLENINMQKGILRTQITELKLEQTHVNQLNSTRNAKLAQIEENKKIIATTKVDIERLEKDKKDITAEKNSAINFNAKRLDMQAQMVGQHLDKVTLKLYDLVKSTGEIKPTFKLMYEGREFQVLSGAERIKAGLEISNLIINLLNLQLPIFIDNSESITHYNKPNTQIIETRVVEGSELNVEKIKQNKEEAA